MVCVVNEFAVSRFKFDYIFQFRKFLVTSPIQWRVGSPFGKLEIL